MEFLLKKVTYRRNWNEYKQILLSVMFAVAIIRIEKKTNKDIALGVFIGLIWSNLIDMFG